MASPGRFEQWHTEKTGKLFDTRCYSVIPSYLSNSRRTGLPGLRAENIAPSG